MTNPDNPLQRYKIRKKIGTGGMASVFLAHDAVLKRDVALKMVHPHLLHQPETIKRFSNEAQAIATLSHEHIIRIFDYGEVRSRPFIVMEYVDGITLEELIAREGTLPPLTTIGIALQILSGLLSAHEKGIYHRDIKRGNIIIDTTGSLRITDFGIAYLVNAESVTLTGSFIGSPHYISPEQVSNKPVQGTTDIFSLGIVLYQCCSGVIPFRAETPHGVIHAILTAEPPDLRLRNGRILFELADCIEWFLTKDPALRPGAKDAIGRMRTLCSEVSIVTGKERLAAFIGNAGAQRSLEEETLFAHFQKKGHTAITQRCFADGLRAFDQASRFGTLSVADNRVIENISRRRELRRKATVAGVVLSATVLAVLLFLAVIEYADNPARSVRDDRELSAAKAAASESRTRDAVQEQYIDSVAMVQTTAPEHPVAHQAVTKAAVVSSALSEPAGSADLPDSITSTGVSGGAAAGYPDPVPGFLRCLTNPPWVTVFVDGIERGATPTLSIIPLAQGRHEVKFAKSEFAEWVDTVAVVAAETTLVRVRLIPYGKDTLSP